MHTTFIHGCSVLKCGSPDLRKINKYSVSNSFLFAAFNFNVCPPFDRRNTKKKMRNMRYLISSSSTLRIRFNGDYAAEAHNSHSILIKYR